jgi:glutathione synthase/RimK-type ligase-like ATP-grasp enzyme
VRSADGGLFVLEVNSMPAWSGLQSVAPVDIADAIAEALLSFLAARDRQNRAAPGQLRLASANSR